MNTKYIRILLIGMSILILFNCKIEPTTASKCVEDNTSQTDEFISENYERYLVVSGKAKSWLQQLDVNPIKLRKAGIKGKKVLVELLDIYYLLSKVASEDEAKIIGAQVREIFDYVSDPKYHDMLSVDDKVFKQGSTSYLRAAYLFEKMGYDISEYRKEIIKIHKRLNDHLNIRGPNQRMAFEWYYDHFGLEKPALLEKAYKQGVIARRLDPYEFKKPMLVYSLTHEIFVPFHFGDNLDATDFSEEDSKYLKKTIERLIVYYIMMENPDLVGELATCMYYLGLTSSSIYTEAIEYLLNSQRSEGKWGDYPGMEKKFGDLADERAYLHTTNVALSALVYAFEF